MKITPTLLAGTLLMLPLLAQAESDVTVHYPHQQNSVQVSHADNLATLAANPAIAGKTWWPATTISTPSATLAVQAEKQQLLASLQSIINQLKADDDGMASVVQSVWQQVNDTAVTGRQSLNLDPDWVRVHQGANRPLVGNYDLYLASPPDSVRLAGVVSHPGTVPWQPGKTVAEYLNAFDRQPGAERNYALLITPDGQSQKVPVAYWNKRHVEPPAGSILFVGFADWTLPGDEQVINHRLVSVLTHRIPD